MSRSKAQGLHRRHNLVLALITVAVVGVLGIVVANIVATEKLNRVLRGWDETFGTTDEIATRFPTTKTTAQALRVETLSADLGIDLVPFGVEGRRRPDERLQAEHKRTKSALGGYLFRQLERPDSSIDAPPEIVAAFLATHADAILALQRELARGEVPHWAMELERIGDAPIPNLLGHVELQKLLLADALARTHRGDHGRARAGLEASWRLNAGIRDDPILIEQLIALSVARMQAGVVRHLVDLPGEWPARLSEHDFRESLLTALRHEGWVWSRLGASGALQAAPQRPNPLKRAAQAVISPYIRFCVADVSDDWRRRLIDVAAAEYACAGDLASAAANLEVPIANWNLVGGAMVPNLAGALERLARLEIDLELTSKLLRVDAARLRNAGTWPETLPGIEISTVCPRDRWEYRRNPDGSVSIAFGRELAPTDLTRPRIPLRHTLPR